MTDDELRFNFTNHPPETPEIAADFDDLTTLFVSTAVMLNELLPESREKSLTITKLEECSMFAKACLARNQHKIR